MLKSYIPKGERGDRGEKGEPGERGTNGRDGKDGRDGRDGVGVTPEQQRALSNLKRGFGGLPVRIQVVVLVTAIFAASILGAALAQIR